MPRSVSSAGSGLRRGCADRPRISVVVTSPERLMPGIITVSPVLTERLREA